MPRGSQPIPCRCVPLRALFWLLALGATLAVSSAAEPAARTPAVVTPIHDAFADHDGDQVFDRIGDVVTIKGVLLADPVPVANGLALADLQDETGGATLFAQDRDLLVGRVQRGDVVMATGRISVYHGLPELVITDVARAGVARLPAPKDVKVAELASGRFDQELVRVSGTLEVPQNFAADDKLAVLHDETGAVKVWISDRVLTNEDFVARLVRGGHVEVTGICNRFGAKAEYRLLPRDEQDFHFSLLLPLRAILIGVAFLGLLAYALTAMVRRRRADRHARELRDEARRAANERDRFFTLSVDLLCIATLTGELKRANPAFTATLGWSIEEVLARPFLDLVHPEDHARTQETLARLAQGETVNHLENRCRCKDGSWRVLAWHAVPQPGGVMYATGRDVTDLRRAEEALRALNGELEKRVIAHSAEARQALAALDAAEDGAFIVDAETLRFTYVNEGAVRQLGYTRTELLGMTAVDIGTEYSERDLRSLLEPMVRGIVRSRQLTTVHRAKNGTRVPVEINIQYVAVAGERPRFISMVRDITERQKTDSLLRRSQRLDALGTLAGGVAHDLNNALTPIVMSLGMLKMQYPQDAQLIDTLHLSAQRGADMVRQLLTFAKRSEGAQVEIAVASLLDEIRQIAKYTFPKNIAVVVTCADNDLRVRGDPTQVHQVLLNLCVNARDAMPDGGTLTLEAKAVELDDTACAKLPEAKPGAYAVIRIVDTGTGIAPEIIDRIFDPFFTTKPADKGTGLGLATAIGIMKSHHGFLQVYSQVGRGSTFSAYFPAFRSGGVATPIPDANLDFIGQNQKVLVVDDEPAVRNVAAAVLKRLSLQPLTATDGTDALLKAAQHRSDLRAVITDLHMPNMGGVALVRALHRLNPALPIIVVSGRMEIKERDECTALGVQVFLEKPFTERQLAEAFNVVLPASAAA